VEVKIGVQHVNRELVLESSQTPQQVQDAVNSALEGKTKVLSLVDDKGRSVIVPAEKLAYVEIADSESRRVGFGAS
jgi:hypothetical protein